MLLNLLLRNYLHFSLYDQAEKLVSKSVFPELANNNEWARYLYYTGKTPRPPPTPPSSASPASCDCREDQSHPAGVLGGSPHADQRPEEGAPTHRRGLQADGTRHTCGAGVRSCAD